MFIFLGVQVVKLWPWWSRYTVNAALGLVAGLVEEVRRKQRSFLYLENQIMYIIFM